MVGKDNSAVETTLEVQNRRRSAYVLTLVNSMFIPNTQTKSADADSRIKGVKNPDLA